MDPVAVGKTIACYLGIYSYVSHMVRANVLQRSYILKLRSNTI